MRISDWSSDVCSSDLILPLPLRRQGEAGRGWSRLGLIPKAPLPNPPGHRAQLDGVRRAANQWFANGLPHPLPSQGREQSSRLPLLLHSICEKSEERRVGKECVSKCRFRGERSHSKKKYIAIRNKGINK